MLLETTVSKTMGDGNNWLDSWKRIFARKQAEFWRLTESFEHWDQSRAEKGEVLNNQKLYLWINSKKIKLLRGSPLFFGILCIVQFKTKTEMCTENWIRNPILHVFIRNLQFQFVKKDVDETYLQFTWRRVIDINLSNTIAMKHPNKLAIMRNVGGNFCK